MLLSDFLKQGAQALGSLYPEAEARKQKIRDPCRITLKGFFRL